jgi:glycosyltransferase involved in cell wall biosynthesis
MPPSPFKTTQVMLAEGFGGAERHFVDLSVCLAERGYPVQAIFHPDFSYQDQLQHPNITCAPVKVHGAWDFLAKRKIKQLIAEFQPSVVHTHLARGAHLGGDAAHALGIPTVVNLHNYVKLKYYRNIDFFIVATRDQRKYLMDHGIADSQIEFMPHFSPLPMIPPRPLQPGQPVHFITLGRMVHKKGFEVLIRAFRAYLDAGHQGHLTIGGDGEERPMLEQLIQKLALDQQVTLSGWVREVGAFLAQGDVFVLPSLDEPFGIVVLEAMAAGKPIIATRTKGPVEILDDDHAYFCEIGDDQTLSQAMQEVARFPEQASEKAKLSSQRYLEQYSAEAIVPRVEAVYRQLLGIKEAD